MNPEVARHYYNQGVGLIKTDTTQAYRLMASAVYEDPTFREGWQAYANLSGDLGKFQAAIACYRRVLEIDENDVNALCNMAQRLFRVGEIDEASIVVNRLLVIDPNNFRGHINRSVISSEFGELAESLEAARKAYCIEASPESEFALALAYLYAGIYNVGLHHLRARYDFAESLSRFRTLPMPMWRGEEPASKRLLLIQDQGIGDALSFMRFVPLAAAKFGSVHVQVRPEMIRLTAVMLREVGSKLTVGPLTQELPAADYWAGFEDLPPALGLTNQEIIDAKSPSVPYQSIAATAQWKVPGRNFHIGIAWAGDPRNQIDSWRSMDLENFLQLYRVPGIQLYSLQVGERQNDIFDKGCVGLVRDMAPYIRDVMDTCAIMRDLDLVITVESAVRHIAGVLGVECWVPYAYHGGDWRAGRDREHPLWDPKTTLFKQGKTKTWPQVFEDINDMLFARIS